ncbi:MAG: c-type cytochrome [Bacteroidota bacterium]
MINTFTKKRIIFFALFSVAIFACNQKVEKKQITETDIVAGIYIAPDTSLIPKNEFGELVKYGRELIINTAYYIGPEGKNGKYLGNKMNCQNCHLDAGTKPYGINFFSTHGRYPQYRARENRVLNIAERINNCVERPHSGKPLPLDSKEILAISCYIKWLGENVPVGGHVEGDKLMEIDLLERAADSKKGETVYIQKCALCHGKDGEGKMKANNICYEYPPLWGTQSYQAGSSMHRVTKAAKFIYANMPNGANYKKPTLTIEEAFDVAAFINNDSLHKRPQPVYFDYPNKESKPIDYGKGPYLDSFPEAQHKYGPYQLIINFYKAKGLKVNL